MSKGKKKSMGISQRQLFCPGVEDQDTLKLLKMGNVRIAVAFQLGSGLVSDMQQ